MTKVVHRFRNDDPALLAYENRNYAPPLAKILTINMLTMSHNITVPVDRFCSAVGK